MATNYDDINKTEQVKNILTEAQLAEMVAKGTVPPNEEFFTFDDDEDVNLDCLRTEVIYNKADSNKQLGQPNGILVGSSISSDFSKYDRLKVYCQGSNEVSSKVYEIDLSRPAPSAKVSGYPYMGVGTDTAFDDIADSNSSVGIYFDISLVNTNKTTFMHYRSGFTVGATPSYRDSSYNNYYIYKIEGILKTPAMIYTGRELHEGEGIGIKDGVVSQKVISKSTSCVQIAGGKSFTGPNYQTVASFTITTKGGRIFASYCIPLYTSGNVAYTAVHVDGVNYGQEVRMTGSTPRHLNNTVITPELSPGVHTVQLIVRGQKDSNTLTIPSYETGYLLGAEL